MSHLQLCDSAPRGANGGQTVQPHGRRLLLVWGSPHVGEYLWQRQEQILGKLISEISVIKLILVSC